MGCGLPFDGEFLNFRARHTFEIETPLSVHEVVGALQSHTEPFKWHRWFLLGNHKIFEGNVSTEGFKIWRILLYQGNLPPRAPLIQGVFRKGQQGTVVSVRMELHPSVVAEGCWSCGVLGAIFLIGVATLWNGPYFLALLLILLGLLLFQWLRMYGWFWLQVKRTRPIFEKISLRMLNETESSERWIRKLLKFLLILGFVLLVLIGAFIEPTQWLVHLPMNSQRVFRR